ncbi:MAG: hypothetical protein RIC14_06740 [Filomicrobium sp.]
MSDEQLTRELNDRLSAVEGHIKELEKDPWWGLNQYFSPHWLGRTYIRHPLAYRVKGSLFGSLFLMPEPPWIMLLFPLFCWVIGPEARREVLRPFLAYFEKCEAEDILDEIKRRQKSRKQS